MQVGQMFRNLFQNPLETAFRVSETNPDFANMTQVQRGEMRKELISIRRDSYVVAGGMIAIGAISTGGMLYAAEIGTAIERAFGIAAAIGMDLGFAKIIIDNVLDTNKKILFEAKKLITKFRIGRLYQMEN